MIDHMLKRLSDLVASRQVKLREISEAAGLPYSTVHEILQPDWTTRAVDNLRALEGAVEKIEAIAATRPPEEEVANDPGK